MPIYKYICQDCGERFKLLVRTGEDGDQEEDDPVCPNCGSSAVRKEVPNVGIRFKGSGFYRTDYKGNGGNGSSKTSASSSDSSTDKED